MQSKSANPTQNGQIDFNAIASDFTLLKGIVSNMSSIKDLDQLVSLVQDRKSAIYEYQTVSMKSMYKVGDCVVVKGKFTKNIPIAGVISKINKKTVRLERLCNCHDNVYHLSLTYTCFSVHPCYIIRRITKAEHGKSYKKAMEEYLAEKEEEEEEEGAM